MYKYKLIQKGKPNDKDAPKKWYATSISEKPQSTKAMTKAATQNTSTAPIEMEASLELFGKHAIEQLREGHSVRIGNIGTLRLVIGSEGTEEITKFSASMIRGARIQFTPSKEFREGVIQGLQFQNAGVLQDGISYATLADYKKAKGIGGGGSGESESPDEI